MGLASPLPRARVAMRRAVVAGRPLAVPASVSRPVTSCLRQAGPREEAAGLVGEGGEGALAPIVEGGEAGGAAVDDGGEVRGARPAGPACGGGPGDVGRG